MAGKDEWNTVKTILNKVLGEDDTEKLVSSMRNSMSHDFEQILNQFAKKI